MVQKLLGLARIGGSGATLGMAASGFILPVAITLLVKAAVFIQIYRKSRRGCGKHAHVSASFAPRKTARRITSLKESKRR
jgi:hypothetical protein